MLIKLQKLANLNRLKIPKVTREVVFVIVAFLVKPKLSHIGGQLIEFKCKWLSEAFILIDCCLIFLQQNFKLEALLYKLHAFIKKVIWIMNTKQPGGDKGTSHICGNRFGPPLRTENVCRYEDFWPDSFPLSACMVVTKD